MTAFVDTAALYALLDRDDDNHEAAATEWPSLLASGAILVVTNYVLVETTALLQHRLGMDAVRAFTDELEPALTAEWITREDHQAARAALVTADRRKLSLVDCSSFEVMRRLGLRQAFTFDRHFAEQGFELVPDQTR